MKRTHPTWGPQTRLVAFEKRLEEANVGRGSKRAIAKAVGVVIRSWRHIWAIYLLEQLHLAQYSQAAAKTKCNRQRQIKKPLSQPRETQNGGNPLPFISCDDSLPPPAPQNLNLLVEVEWLRV